MIENTATKSAELAVSKSKTDTPVNNATRTLTWTPKSIYRTRMDVKNWNIAQNMAMDVITPRNYLLQLLLADIRLDALLTSQIENRKQQVFYAPFSLKDANGNIDEEQTKLLSKSIHYKSITDAILEKKYVGYNMIELSLNADKTVVVTLIPRTNYVPQVGLFYDDYLDATNPIKYRELPEYGKWILEFFGDECGLLNKSVPHILFKRFAQSCWSELCEIYGIPPRVMKTNTQDPNMLNRAESMMRDMGAAAWFIIDETEDFEFASAQSGTINGDVYKNLIQLCNSENSLLISGAVIGQDTVNGNRSKEESSQNMLYQLVQGDMKAVESDWNNIVIPALVSIGALPAGLTFEFNPTEDIDQLFKFTAGLLPFKNVDNEWIEQKFGVKVTGDRITPTNDNEPDDDSKEDKAVQKAIDKKLSAFFG
jgi:hypothetical protein